MPSSSTKHFSLLIFISLAILFTASSQVEARDSRFFSKFTRLIGTTNNVITEVPTPAPAPAPAQAPSPEALETVPVPAPAPETSFGTETENGYGFYGTQETPVTTTTDVESEKLTGEERFDNGYGESNYNYYGNNKNGYGSEKSRSEQQGMSDTRYLENGKYYHDERNDNYRDHENNYYNGYDDQTAKRGTRYVFDSMEEYEKYQESQGTYVP